MNGSDNKNNRKRSIPALLRRYYDLLWYSFNPVVFFRVFARSYCFASNTSRRRACVE